MSEEPRTLDPDIERLDKMWGEGGWVAHHACPSNDTGQPWMYHSVAYHDERPLPIDALRAEVERLVAENTQLRAALDEALPYVRADAQNYDEGSGERANRTRRAEAQNFAARIVALGRSQ